MFCKYFTILCTIWLVRIWADISWSPAKTSHLGGEERHWIFISGLFCFTYACVDRSTLLLKDKVPCLQFCPQEIQIVRILWKNFKDSNKHSSHQRICLYQCLYWIPRINFHSRVNSGFQDYIGNCFTWRAAVQPTGILCWFGFCKFSFDYFDDSVDVDFDLANHSPCE